MAYLYQRIMNVPGLTGSSSERQRQLYERLGAPMGSYTGSLDQNSFLLNNINQGNTGQAAATPQAQTPRQVAMNTQPTIPGTTFPVPNKMTPFEEVLPYDRVFNRDFVNQLGMQQIMPEISRERRSSMRELDRGLAGSGAFRMGVADTSRRSLNDFYTRSLRERVSDFTNTIDDYTSNWYNQQMERYATNPARFKLPTLPTFDQYSQQRTQASAPATRDGAYGSRSRLGTGRISSLFN